MRWPTLSCLLALLCDTLSAQYVYTIKADSVKITNCDSAELILENHTQNIPGFLFNTGNGRTVFKRVLQKINDSVFLIGPDTLDIPVKLVATNGLDISNDTVQLGGSMLNTATISTANNRIWFRTPFKSAEDTTRTGQIFYGDSDYIQPWKNPPAYNQDGQYNAAVVISKTKENNDENVDLLCLTTADAPGRNGWRFYDYTNVSGLVCPRLETYSNAGNTDYAFEHDIYGKAQSNPMYMLNFLDYDSENVASSYSPTAADFFAIANNYNVGFYVDNHFDVGIGKKPTPGMRLDVAGSANILDTLNAGMVGIGTASPTAQLHTTGSVRFAGLTLDSTQTNVVVSDANGNLFYRSASSLAADEPVRPSLAVRGTIRSKNIIISPDDWADCVFDSSYRLPRLAEVESYIRREHHLPGIPSAAAVQRDSLDVGAGQAALLKKIEELTLYTIDQDKKIQSLEDEVEILKKMILEDRKEKPTKKQ